jgi:hypothetical protein
MSESTISIIISLVALSIALLSFFESKTKRKKPEEPSAASRFNAIPLQLQAYERLALLCERISIPNLISRVNQPNASAQEMQILLLEHIKQEFEYNASQQVYVSKVTWDAVRNLRDQSMLIINQVSNLLSPEARATELNKKLLEVMINHEDAALHTIVLDALSHEAKKLMA